MTVEIPAERANLNVSFRYEDMVDACFLQTALAEKWLNFEGDNWVTGANLEAAPGKVVARASYFHSARREALVRLDGALAHLILTDRSLTVRVAGRSIQDVQAARVALRESLPELHGDDREVPVRFWWWQPPVAQEMARMMPAPAWEEIAENYAASTRPQVAGIAGWRHGPPPGGRLMLWHGAPGTGKTTALRALAWEWRAWAEFQFVTDPEQFLSNPSYLLRTISSRYGADGPASRLDRWRILVLEDAGEYLAPDAKHLAGQALSRLLNVCDGVLGQATRCLVLVTTNEALHSLHPALSRPGRCLAQVEFAPLSAEELERWCRARDLSPLAASRATVADLYAHLAGRAPKVERLFGFSQAS